MPEVRPLRALHYNLGAVGSLEAVIAPPYDVIDRRDAPRAARALAVQRRRDRPTRGARRRRSVRARRRDARGVDARRDPRGRPRAGDLGADAGVHGARRRRPNPPRSPRPRPYNRVRARPDPTPRAHPAWPQGGSPPTHRGDATQPLADLLALPRGRVAARRAGPRRRPVGRGNRRRRHHEPRVADPRPGRPRGRRLGPRRRRAADRGRPSSLRDRPRLRRRDRRRGAAPLRADVPRLARGPGPDRLPNPSRAHRARLVPTRSASRGPRGPVRDGGGLARTDRPGGRRRARCVRLPRYGARGRRPPSAPRPRARSTGRSRTAPTATASSTS